MGCKCEYVALDALGSVRFGDEKGKSVRWILT